MTDPSPSGRPCLEVRPNTAPPRPAEGLTRLPYLFVFAGAGAAGAYCYSRAFPEYGSQSLLCFLGFFVCVAVQMAAAWSRAGNAGWPRWVVFLLLIPGLGQIIGLLLLAAPPRK